MCCLLDYAEDMPVFARSTFVCKICDKFLCYYQMITLQDGDSGPVYRVSLPAPEVNRINNGGKPSSQMI